MKTNKFHSVYSIINAIYLHMLRITNQRFFFLYLQQIHRHEPQPYG